jgi:hypothetical protein
MVLPKSGKVQYAELGILLCLSFLAEIISLLVYFTFHGNPNQVGNIFNLLNLPIVILLYQRNVNWRDKYRVSFSLITLFIAFGLANLFFIQGSDAFNSYTNAVASVIFIVIAIIYFYLLILETPADSITDLPFFWISSAILMYYSGTFWIYLQADYLINVLKDNLIMTWLFHNSFGLIFYAILGYTMFVIRTEQRNVVKGRVTNTY